MTKIRITKIFHFEMAHALVDYKGLCQNIHGHSYQLEVRVSGCINQHPDKAKKGMVMDFSDLKNIVDKHIIQRYDHALILNSESNAELIKQLKQNYKNIIIVDYQPTSEQLLEDFAGRLKKNLPPYASLHSIRLSETQSSYAEWYADDNKDE
ncbi:MAG: 6-carboxytetrahydropterin synthase [Bacteroidales bacterium]|jgi:6-pyruvoyltetrahydropterin/6-carboxytetrahydropterin synthase|nr:6-carboxytetrahydropterin synthase [Bacteroidales bacterium]MDD4210465.1 6-carboxytetrahydropterin synthase [Bacteroidales bacterium]MDY0015447.1 6-carboxytetrahydropterin synthase [Bacteroidales bacterium]